MRKWLILLSALSATTVSGAPAWTWVDANGADLLGPLKRAARSDCPVIMVTGRRERDIVVESLNAGAVDFVVKPLDKSVLMTKLRKALGRL